MDKNDVRDKIEAMKNGPVPPTIATDDQFREIYGQGYRHALGNVLALLPVEPLVQSALVQLLRELADGIESPHESIRHAYLVQERQQAINIVREAADLLEELVPLLAVEPSAEGPPKKKFDDFCEQCITTRWCAHKGDCLAECLPTQTAEEERK